MSTYQERFEQNFMSTSHPYITDNAGNASGNWCASRWSAKAAKMASDIMYYWGLAKEGNEPRYPYKCGSIGNLYGLFGIKTRYYYGNGYPISVFEAREMIDCEKIETLEIYALTAMESADLRLTTMGSMGGSAAKNAKMDRRKWEIISDWTTSVRGTSDGEGFDTCAEEGLASVYDEAAEALEKDLNKMGKPLDPTLLFALIGGGVLASVLIINKAVR